MKLNERKDANRVESRSIISKIISSITKNRNRVVIAIILAVVTYIVIDIVSNWSDIECAFIEGWNDAQLVE